MNVDLSWSVERDDAVRFVACRVHNAAAVPRRVRVRNRIDGPVLPPRRSGVPESGWDAAGVTLRLEPNERRGVGFAVVASTDGRTADPPVEIAAVDPIDDRDAPAVTADAAVRSLGDHRPPRDVLADPERAEPAVTAGTDPGTRIPESPAETGDADERAADASAEDHGPAQPGDRDAPRSPTDCTGDPTNRRGSRSRSDDRGTVPAGVDALGDRLERVERRVDRAERLTDADLGTATEAVGRLGGVAAVASLEERVANDAAALRRLSERASSLAARAEATDVPTDALERLA